MTITKRSLCAFLTVLVVLALCPVQAFAAGKILPDEDVVLLISYKDDMDNSKPIPKARFNIYKVADVDEWGQMTLTTDFEPYKYQVTGLANLNHLKQDQWDVLASTLKGYVQANSSHFSKNSGRTDENGNLSFNVKPGLYLVIGYRATTEDFYTHTATPFMIFLPGVDSKNNEWSYEVTAYPKSEKHFFPPENQDPVITRKVLKLWNDMGYETIRPNEIVVQLLRDGYVFDTVSLNARNGWRYSWDDLDAEYEWTVVEKEIPNYAVSVTQTGITFSIINTYFVPITVGDPPVQKRISGNVPQTTDTFTFVMKANDPSNPMPKGSNGTEKELIIKGAGRGDFGEITFEKPGIYKYTVSEKSGNIEGYTYDAASYTIIFDVVEDNGELSYTRSIIDKNGNAVTVMEFTNQYKTPGSKLPQTGSLWWPVPALLLAGCVFVLIGIVRRRRCNG